MLQKLREKTSGWIAIVILGLLMIPFLFFGVENYFNAQTATYVAKVGDEEISQEEFQQRFQEYRMQMRRMLGERFDSRQFEQPTIKRQFLDRLIEEKLLIQQAAKTGVVVTPAQLQKEILGMEAFQVAGQFDQDRYVALLRNQSMSPASFEERLGKEMAVQAVTGEIQRSGIATGGYLDSYLSLRDQKRSFHYLMLEPPALDSVVDVSAEELQAYYDAHPDAFTREESVSLEYLQMSPANVDVPVTVSEETLRERYEEQSARFVDPESRLASHILVSVPADADADAVRAAQEKAQAIADAARQDGADFAELAKKDSDDFGSKATGGDIGWIEKGITDPAFEDALFAMEAGAVSDPVKGSDGWHVIQLREVREGQAKPFEEVRAELEKEYLDGERERQFNDQGGRLVDTIYRDPTTLNTASSELGLDVQSTGFFDRNGGDGIAAYPAVVDAAFSESVLAQGNVSDPINLPDGSLVAIRVKEHKAATVTPFEDVRDRVETLVKEERIAGQARTAADAALAEAKAGKALSEMAEARELELQKGDAVTRGAVNLDRELITRVFELPHPVEGQSEVGMAELSGNRYALIQLESVTDGDPASIGADVRSALSEQLAGALGGVEARAYVDALRAGADIKVAEDRL
ncbi:MAG: SurA N-terminal domain-containing protein [Lysobacteraceae bacterium]